MIGHLYISTMGIRQDTTYLYISPMGIRQDTTIGSQPVYLMPRSFFWIRNTTCTFKPTTNDPRADRGGAPGQLFLRKCNLLSSCIRCGVGRALGYDLFPDMLCCWQWGICRVLIWEGVRWKRHGLDGIRIQKVDISVAKWTHRQH